MHQALGFLNSGSQGLQNMGREMLMETKGCLTQTLREAINESLGGLIFIAQIIKKEDGEFDKSQFLEKFLGACRVS